MQKTCGIYAIKNRVSGRVYVGQSVSIEARKNGHFHDLRMGKHASKFMQRAFNKNGFNAFEHVILEVCKQHELTEREQFWMDFFRPLGLYNTVLAAGSTFGFRHSADSRKKMSASHVGKRMSPETRLRMSLAQAGRKMPESFSKKMSVIHKGKTISEETRKKLSLHMIGRPSLMLGRSHSEEAKRNMSASQMGKIMPDDVRAKIAQTLKGRIFTQEHREKLSKSLIGKESPNKGKNRPKEVCERISAAKKGKSNGLLGKKLTEEHKNNMRLAQLRRLGKIE